MAQKSPSVVRQVTPTIATFSRPFARFGVVPIGGRTTAVKLSGENGVWVLASTPLDDVTKDKLREMGEVKYVVAGDFVHHLYVGDYAKEYPNAKVIGVEGLPEKRTDVKFDGVYGKDGLDTKYGYEDEIQAHYFPTFSNRDVAFLHKESKSLVVVDLLFNLPATEQYKNTEAGKPTSWIPFVGGLTDKLKPANSLHQSFLWKTGILNDISSADKQSLGSTAATSTAERRSRFAKDAETVAGWDFDRIIPCHGDVIETGGKKSWLQALSNYLNPEGKVKV